MFKFFSALAVVIGSCGVSAWSQENPALAEGVEAVIDTAAALEERLGTEQPVVDLFAKDTFRLRPLVCPFNGRIDYDPELIHCEMLEVPENREAENGRMIELLVLTITPEEPEDWDVEEQGAWSLRDDPMVYLQGGPGGPGYGFVNRFVPVAEHTMRKLMILDQRGVGYSDNFCPYYGLANPEAANADSFAEAVEHQMNLTRLCLDGALAAGVDLQGYSNEENARDVIALRRALGLDEWNVWGISYGSTLALELLRQDTKGLRSTIIDGIAPVDYPDLFSAYGYLYHRALGEMQAACDGVDTCGANFPDITGQIRSAVSLVEGEPIVIEDALNPEIYPSGSATFFQDFVAGLPFLALYASDLYPSFPAMVDAMAASAEEGSLDERLRFLTSGRLDFFGDFAAGMNFTVTCQLGWLQNTAEAYPQDRAAFGELSLLGSERAAKEPSEICKDYGLLPHPIKPLQTNVPTLIANGQIDPITPPESAEHILPFFSQAQYVKVPFEGHGPTATESTCAYDLMREFLDAPTEDVDMTCLTDEMEAPAFWGPLWRTMGVTNVLSDQANDGKLGLILGGLSGLIALSFVLITGGSAARFINPSNFSYRANLGGGRLFTWLGAGLAVGGVGTVGYAGWLASEEGFLSLLFGLPGFARWGAVAALAGSLPALLGLWGLMTHLFAPRVPAGTFFGMLITNAAVIGLAVTVVIAGFAPWIG